jgi:hypothetical protein
MEAAGELFVVEWVSFPKDEEMWIMDAIREVPLESLLKPLSVEPERHRLCLSVRHEEAIKLELYGMTAAPDSPEPGERAADAAGPELVPCHVVVYVQLTRVKGKKSVQLAVEAPSCVSIGRSTRAAEAVCP